ncbi:MAG: hypothetical protein R3C02_08850 [Planctomycetaceae bacterium]
MNSKRPQRRSRRQSHSSQEKLQIVPFGSELEELFAGGSSGWLKIVGAAVTGPIVTILAFKRDLLKGQSPLLKDPFLFAIVLGASFLIGGLLGASLTLKDIVRDRMSQGQTVSLSMKLLFGWGIWSVLLVWTPMIIFLALVGSLLSI